MINQFTGKNHKSSAPLFSKRLISGIEKLGQLPRITGRRPVCKPAGLIILDARFRCVAGNKTKLRIPGAFHICIIITIRIQAAADAGNHTFLADFPPIFAAPQKQRVKPFLFIDKFTDLVAAADWLN